jgi:hypothetical protein
MGLTTRSLPSQEDPGDPEDGLKVVPGLNGVIASPVVPFCKSTTHSRASSKVSTLDPDDIAEVNDFVELTKEHC